MMKSTYFDAIFILVAAALLYAIVYSGKGDILRDFSFIFILSGYYIGKYVRQYELKPRKNKEVE